MYARTCMVEVLPMFLSCKLACKCISSQKSAMINPSRAKSESMHI